MKKKKPIARLKKGEIRIGFKPGKKRKKSTRKKKK